MLTRSPYDQTIDWWCVGILLYEMLTGVPPFRHRNTKIMFDYIFHANIIYPKYISANAKHLISNLLQRNPKKRLGHQGSQQIKSHAFFKDINWDKLYKKEIRPPFQPTIQAGSLI